VTPGNSETISSTNEVTRSPSVVEAMKKLPNRGRVKLTACMTVFPDGSGVIQKGLPNHLFNLGDGPRVGMKTDSIPVYPRDLHN
jgi:hypothetical protein